MLTGVEDFTMAAGDASKTNRAGVLAAVAGAREETLDALERLSDDRALAAGTSGAMVALQAAANELGVAEQALGVDARSASEAPPPILTPDHPDATAGGISWTGEALAVMALAELSVPYAPAPADEVDDWLRALRQAGEGKVGRALGELGFPDGELSARAEPPRTARRLQAVQAVRAKAAELARRRRAAAATTVDVLFAIFAEYPALLVKSTLYERSITERALLEHIGGGGRSLR
jgi:hypothetical protein